MTRFHPSAPGPWPPFHVAIDVDWGASPTWYASVSPGKVLERQRATDASNMIYWEPANLLTDGIPTRFAATSGYSLYLTVLELLPAGTISEVFIEAGASDLQSVETAGTNVVYHYKFCDFSLVNGVMEVVPFLMGSHIYHWPEGQGLDLVVQDYDFECGFLTAGSSTTHYWRQGRYIGTTDPGTTPDHTQNVTNINVI